MNLTIASKGAQVYTKFNMPALPFLLFLLIPGKVSDKGRQEKSERKEIKMEGKTEDEERKKTERMENLVWPFAFAGHVYRFFRGSTGDRSGI